MKKILVKIFLLLSLCSFGVLTTTSYTYAVKVTVTEKVPGANCWSNIGSEKVPRYECNLWTGFWAIMSMIGKMIKYATFIAGLAWVLFIVVNGIMYSMSGMDAGMKDEAKKRITKTLLWLVVLFLSWLILNAIAPWVYVV